MVSLIGVSADFGGLLEEFSSSDGSRSSSGSIFPVSISSSTSASVPLIDRVYLPPFFRVWLFKLRYFSSNS